MLLSARPLHNWRCCIRSGPGASQVWPAVWRRSCTAAAPEGQPAAPAGVAGAVEPQWNDIVEYLLPRPLAGARLGVGRIDRVEDGRVTLAPLEEDEEEVWVESHDVSAVEVPEGSVVRILSYDFSQRQDKEGNPHGEHAHDVYTLLDHPSADVYRGPRTLTVVVRRAAA
ncbi:hypothetical protein PLESTB_000386100 [Pleodorina starrii]|uniref:Uncharacterized protein n=1 Tax=Pleodorina starrii TaxID=330485 RepID=A0A9W6BEY8_9CHLO|nr:hypothetical protein PLESTM_000008600 [Pleodorina starrii]GLC50498.1 hypothetical protein PLESTB_000386100 [Pleodorina starrii]GLC73263.1 hypothetical protein PLESTF_001353700 [Pleodorina starrii]